MANGISPSVPATAASGNGCVDTQTASAMITVLQNIVTAINGLTSVLTK
jgi:hypothetical protein